jgi:4-hydroxybenzoate polyprenyltransferase
MPARIEGLVRLVHPFPSLLNGLVTGALALLAGGGATTALRLAASMLALQCSIGAVNDLVDAARDAGHKPAKPVPRGLVSPAEARVVAAVGLAAGLLLAVPSGLATLLTALAGAGAGYLYDLRLKGTRASWLPFALGIPLLPVFAWLGSSGTVPASFVILVPVAAVSGSALAVANALADHERDLAAGSASVATALGFVRAWLVHAALQGVVLTVGLAALSLLGVEIWLAIAAAGVILVGVVLTASQSPLRRELGWEIEAAGTGVLAVAWLAGTAGATVPGG